MATWVCSTKKFLSSAITSIAGELEQTVLDFNDAIHNLSNKQEAARVHGAPSEIHPHSTVVEHPPQAARVHKEPSEIHPHSTVVEHRPTAKPLTGKSDVVLALDPQQCETSLPHLQESETVSDLQESETCPPHLQESETVSDLQESETYFQLPAVTTKQPQTIGFAPILNARLSRSSPSLFPEDASWERKSESSDRSSPLDSIYSASSPCLYQQTHTQTHTQTQGCLQTRRLFYRENPNFSQTQKINLPVPEVISRGDTLEFQGSNPGRFGRSRVVCQKRPGRVVRTSGADEQQTTGEQTSDSSGDVTDRQCVLVNAPTHVSIERDPHPLRWMTLGPLSRVLSFAFSQLANIILMLSDDQQTYDRPPSRQLTYDRPPSQQLTLTYDTPRQQTTPDLQTHEGHFQTICDVISPDSSIIRSTYSCESFEIIDPCDPCSHDPCSHDPRRVRLTPPPGERSFLSRLYHGNHDNTDSLSVSAFVSVNPGLTSSAEFVNFNFKELIINRHFNTLNPVLAADVTQPSDVTQSDVSADSPDLMHAGADDDGDDDSTSFSIISDNDNEEFIVV